MTAAIEVRALHKRFGGTAALKGCSLAIPAGSITGLIGPNGAGKTTLLDIVCGQVVPDHGSVLLRGEDITGLPAHRRAGRGLARTFQVARDLPGLTVLETMLRASGRRASEGLAGALFKRRAMHARERALAGNARRLLERVGLWSLADAPASSISGGQKKLLDIARVLMLEPTVVCLDEPAAGVSPPLLAELVALIRELNGRGLTFALVEHDMHLVRSLCDEVHVLVEGQRLVSGSFAAVTANARVVEAYLGIAA